jgi:long-chain acyl-CoA synthetase
MDPEKISDRTTVGTFYRQAERYGNRILIQHHPTEAGWEEVSWEGLARMSQRVAARLVALGVQSGDRVLIMAENRLEWIYSDFGIQSAGAVTVPIYPSTPTSGARSIAADSGAVVAIGSNHDMGSKLAPGATLRTTVSMEDDLPGWIAEEPAAADRAEVDRRLAALGPDDISSIVYTSGTTGEAKGVVLPQRAFVDMARSSLEAFPLGEADVILSFLPFAHVFERTSSIFVGLSAGVTIWLSRGIPSLGDDIAEVRPTVMVSVPRVYEKMRQAVLERVAEAAPHRRLLFRWAVERGRRAARSGGRPPGAAERWVLQPLRERLTGGRLRFFVSGGAPLSREVEEFFWALGVRILNGWGMTETNSGATSNTEQRHKYETVGPPLPGVEVRIAEDGEIVVLSPGNMTGYYNRPEATAEVLVDGWLHSGDMGEIDSDGFVRITDRKKDMIKTAGGKYVAPQMLEARLQEDHLIERAVVIGDQRPYVVALIVPNWNAVGQELKLEGDPERLLADERLVSRVQRTVDDVNAGLGSWESVKYFRMLPHDLSEDQGELTPTLKIKRPAIQRNHAAAIAAMYSAPKPAPTPA